MTFTDTGTMEIENYPFALDDKEYDIWMEIEYSVECNVTRHSHNCPVGEDYPDGEECECRDVSIIDYEVYDWDGNLVDIVLTSDQKRRICLDLFDRAEQHYCDYGGWYGDI